MKLLLLGAGESGKSTFLKQMRIIHGVKFEPELIREYQHVIYQNVVKGNLQNKKFILLFIIHFCKFSGMQVLVDAREKLDIEWEHPNTQLAAEQAIMFHGGVHLDVEQFHQYAPYLHILWQDRAIKKAYDRRREFQIVSWLFYEFIFINYSSG